MNQVLWLIMGPSHNLKPSRKPYGFYWATNQLYLSVVEGIRTGAVEVEKQKAHI